MRRIVLRRIFRSLAFSSVVLGALTGCTKSSETSADTSSVLRLSQRNEPGDLDPATATLPDEFFIIRALSEGLVTPAPATSAPTGNPADSVLPGAAHRWEISDDGRIYTFHLRPDAAWSNGEPVTARDFIESYERLLTPTTGAPKAALFSAVENAAAFAEGKLKDFADVGFRELNPHTLQITLHHPMPQFLVYVASGPWIPVNPRIVERHGRKWTSPANHVGNGPFTLREWRPHQRIVVSRNSRYHSPAHVKLDAIHFVTFDSGDTEDRAYRAGQIDLTMSVPATKLESYARERPAELHRAPLAETRYLTFNTKRPPLNDARVRRALSLAIDRRQLVNHVLKGGQEAADRFVPPTLLAAEKSVRSPAELFESEVAAARQLLADAGFPDGRNFPVLEVSSWPIGPPVLEAVQEMWKRILGIQIRVITREAKVHVAALGDGAYDIGFITAIPDVPDATNFLADFTTNAPGNYPHWADTTFDSLIAEADRDPTRRVERLQAAEARLLQEAPVAPLYFNAKNWLMSSRVRGWQYDALWTRFYLNVELSKN